jgi:flagellar FliL protein
MRFFSLILLVSSLLIPSLSFAEDDEEKKPVAYHKLSPSFVANVKGNAKYMRADIQLMTKDAENIPDIELHAPALRHELLLLFSDQEGKLLKDPKGKEKLRKLALEAIRKVMKELTGKEAVDDLFFTSYFAQ